MSWLDRLRTPPAPQSPSSAFHSRCVDSDGRRREAALLELSLLPADLHARALPLVVARLNDWVPQVRAAAAKALPVLLREDLTPAWLDALPEVVRLMDGARWNRDGAAVRNGVEQFLLESPQRRAALLAFAPRLGVRVRRWLTLRSWWYGSAEERLQTLVPALRGGDSVLARQALRHLQTLSPDWPEVAGVREALRRARFPALRLEALRHAQARGIFPAGDDALDLAFSPHGGTRIWLLFHAADALKQQVMHRAEAMLTEAGPVGGQRIALQVLRELQAASLQTFLVNARAHPAPRLREMAYALSLNLHTDAQRAELAGQALADPSRKVQRTALAALRKGRVELTLAELVALVRREPGTLRVVLDILVFWQAWVRVPIALQLLAEHAVDTDCVAAELPVLQQALRRSLYAPTIEQSWALERAAALLRQRHPALEFSPP